MRKLFCVLTIIFIYRIIVNTYFKGRVIVKIKLSDRFTYKKLFLFTVPSVIMMVFTSVYGVVDGFFVSNYVGKTQFAAVNFIFPFLMILGSIGFMFGAGGSALIAKTYGEGKKDKAQKLFSLIVYTSVVCGFVISVLGFILIRPAAVFLGAEGDMLEYGVIYGRILLLALPASVLQFEFQSLFIAAEKPRLGLFVTVGAGVTNMVLDWLLTAVFSFGIVGAALATAISQTVGGIVPLIYFGLPNSSILRLRKAQLDIKALLRTVINGSSELMSNLSMSLVGMLYNFQLMKYAGEDGVSAYGVMMYVSFVFISIFIGFSVGVAPVISYHYGAENTKELKSLLKKSLIIIGVSSVFMLVLGESLAIPLSKIFVGYDKALYDMTLRGFYIFSFSFLFSGIAIYGSAFFTALNNGLVSALISFLRTLIFQSAAVLVLPLIFEIDGIWCSVVIAEFVAAVVTVLFLLGLKKKYKY